MEQEKKTEKPKKANKWILHTKKVQEENPDLSYKEILTLAKESYVKTPTKEKPQKEQEKLAKPELKREVTTVLKERAREMSVDEEPKQKARKPRKPRKKKSSSDEE